MVQPDATHYRRPVVPGGGPGGRRGDVHRGVARCRPPGPTEPAAPVYDLAA
ncbi:hypothetical protein L083_4248 [Actinoplanes sp. N902-109]|nr:hypothetical protein L083_4248 [Actinoplanes sp. N902-109]